MASGRAVGVYHGIAVPPAVAVCGYFRAGFRVSAAPKIARRKATSISPLAKVSSMGGVRVLLAIRRV